MSTLGIGTRVFIGRCPDDDLAPDLRFDGRLKRGVIFDGPFQHGDRLLDPHTGQRVFLPPGHVEWAVSFDGGEAAFHESMLTPIDDGDQSLETPQKEAAPA